MTLQEIETIVLMQIGYDRYSVLSVASGEKAEDFALLHNCVNMARSEILRNCSIPNLLKIGAAITVAAGTNQYSLPADFDVMDRLLYDKSDSEWELEAVYPRTLLEKVGKIANTGSPSYYMLMDNATAVAQVRLYPVPDEAATMYPIYKPLLTAITTSTDTDLLMTKYPETVIKIATGIGWGLIKKDPTERANWLATGIADYPFISARETSQDNSLKEMPDSLIRGRRAGRLSV